MRVVLLNGYDHTQRLGLEHKLVKVVDELLFDDRTSRECDQLTPGHQRHCWAN